MAMQLEFAQAMSDFKTMFPDMDREVIEAVLRANQGAVDATIDQLLAMSTDNQNEKLRNELDANVSPRRTLINLNDNGAKITSTHPPTAQLIDMTDGPPKSSLTAAANTTAASSSVLLDLSDNEACASPNLRFITGASPKTRPLSAAKTISMPSTLIGGGDSNTPTKQRSQQHGSRRWNPPMLRPLPTNFLRLVPSSTSSHDSARDFDLPDEQFALMLQNEEFMNQLRWNQEFMSALEKEQSGKAKTEDDAAFKERLRNMGKMSRKKFLQMARVFTWQRNKKVTTAKQIDSLPLKEEPSDDEDHNAHHHQQQQQQQQQNMRK